MQQNVSALSAVVDEAWFSEAVLEKPFVAFTEEWEDRDLCGELDVSILRAAKVSAAVPPAGYDGLPVSPVVVDEGHELPEEKFVCEYLGPDGAGCGQTFLAIAKLSLHMLGVLMEC